MNKYLFSGQESDKADQLKLDEIEGVVGNPRLKRVVELIHADPKQFESRFSKWLIEGNWKIYTAFENHAYELIESGFTHYGAKGIWEIIRFHTALADTSKKYKLSNSWHSPCAHLFAALNPAHKDFFSFRERISLRARCAVGEDAHEEEEQAA